MGLEPATCRLRGGRSTGLSYWGARESIASRILENYDYQSHQTFGWHRVSVVGDFRDDIKIAARLLGLEVIEEDEWKFVYHLSAKYSIVVGPFYRKANAFTAA